MGTDTPLAVLSDRPRLVFDYFTQLFAQVTNPPLDAIREELVTSLRHHHRPRAEPARAPAGLLPPDRAALPGAQRPGPGQDRAHQRRRQTCPGWPPTWSTAATEPRGGGAGLRARLAEICGEMSAAIRAGRPPDHPVRPAPGPPATAPSRSRRCMLTGAVHHHLIREQTRTRAGLVVEAGDVRECHHIALLVGFGAAAVNPYLAIESVRGHGAARPARGPDRAAGRGQPDQGHGQGPAQDHVQDGRVHRRLLHRRADLRGHRPRPGGHRDLLRRDHLAAAGVGFDALAAEIAQRTAWPWPTAAGQATGGWPPAASTSGAARASRTCSAPERYSSCSTRPAAASTRSSRSTPRWSMTSRGS